MKTEARKAAVAAWKEREVRAGIYALRCAATDEVWVGAATNLEGVENRIRFMLRFGNHRCAALQAACRAHGEAGLSFEVLEALDPDLGAWSRDGLLKERLAHWRAALGAGRL